MMLEQLEPRMLMSTVVPSSYVPIETINVSATNQQVTFSNATLGEGNDYFLKVSGQYLIRDKNGNGTWDQATDRLADAEFFQEAAPNNSTWLDNRGSTPGAGGFEVGIGTPQDQNLLTQNPASNPGWQSNGIYGLELKDIATSGKLAMLIPDSNYADNSGGLTVELFRKVNVDRFHVEFEDYAAHHLNQDEANTAATASDFWVSPEKRLFGELRGEVKFAIDFDETFVGSSGWQPLMRIVGTNDVHIEFDESGENRTVTLPVAQGYSYHAAAGIDINGNDVLDASEQTHHINIQLARAAGVTDSRLAVSDPERLYYAMHGAGGNGNDAFGEGSLKHDIAARLGLEVTGATANNDMYEATQRSEARSDILADIDTNEDNIITPPEAAEYSLRLVGFSQGGFTMVNVTSDLNVTNTIRDDYFIVAPIHFDKLVTIDPAGDALNGPLVTHRVERNVRDFTNFYQKNVGGFSAAEELDTLDVLDSNGDVIDTIDVSPSGFFAGLLLLKNIEGEVVDTQDGVASRQVRVDERGSNTTVTMPIRNPLFVDGYANLNLDAVDFRMERDHVGHVTMPFFVADEVLQELQS